MLATPEAPDETQLESMLESIQPMPSKAFYRQMHEQPWMQNNKPPQTTAPEHSQFFGALIASTMLIIFISALAIMATPQGQPLAQIIFRFLAPPETQPSLGPTHPFELAPTQPGIESTFEGAIKPVNPAPLMTEAPATAAAATFLLTQCSQTDPAELYRCQVNEADSILSFDLKQLPAEMSGFVFSSLQTDPAGRWVRFHYAGVAGPQTLIITQAFETLPAAEWDEAPPLGLEPVKVNGSEGEYVRSQRLATANAPETAAPLYHLRWAEGALRFEITWLGEPGSLEPVEAQTLIAIAESLK